MNLVMPRIQTNARVVNADIFNLALAVISGDAQESARIRADLAANKNKDERANQRDERTALVDQINWLEKTECDQ